MVGAGGGVGAWAGGHGLDVHGGGGGSVVRQVGAADPGDGITIALAQAAHDVLEGAHAALAALAEERLPMGVKGGGAARGEDLDQAAAPATGVDQAVGAGLAALPDLPGE